MAGRKYPPAEARFKSRIKINESGGCWIFTGRLDKDGYGVLKATDAANTYVPPSNVPPRVCRACNRAAVARYKARRLEWAE